MGQTATTLRFAKLSNDASTPTRCSTFAVGYDLYSAQDTVVEGLNRCPVKTDIQIALPDGCYGRIAPRSGLACDNLGIGGGVIDRDYRGNIIVVLFNFNSRDFVVKKGDCIAQLILEKTHILELEQVDSLEDTERGQDGFESTGPRKRAISSIDTEDVDLRTSLSSPILSACQTSLDLTVLKRPRLTDVREGNESSNVSSKTGDKYLAAKCYVAAKEADVQKKIYLESNEMWDKYLATIYYVSAKEAEVQKKISLESNEMWDKYLCYLTAEEETHKKRCLESQRTLDRETSPDKPVESHEETQEQRWADVMERQQQQLQAAECDKGDDEPEDELCSQSDIMA